MKLKLLIGMVYLFGSVQMVSAVPKVKIIHVSGEVKIRRGVEESWHPAAIGTLLEDIDSILTGEGAEVILEVKDGKTFRLEGNAILDIADLRKITDQELFLFLMSERIQKIGPREEKTRLRIGNINVVHGELKTDSVDSIGVFAEYEGWKLEKNGAKALYIQGYFANAIVKLTKVLVRITNIIDCGEIHFYLGKAFEALNKTGQAMDAYQVVLKRGEEAACEEKWVHEAKEAIQRLKP